MKTEDAKTLAESALDTLAAQLDAGKSAALTAYLASMARFHRYSANNILLIHVQRRDARAWPILWRGGSLDASSGAGEGHRDPGPDDVASFLHDAGNGVGTDDGTTARAILGSSRLLFM